MVIRRLHCQDQIITILVPSGTNMRTAVSEALQALAGAATKLAAFDGKLHLSATIQFPNLTGIDVAKGDDLIAAIAAKVPSKAAPANIEIHITAWLQCDVDSEFTTATQDSNIMDSKDVTRIE